MKRLTILGSTGSIGRNTLQVIRESGDAFEVAALTAGNNVDVLLSQALEFRPALLSLADPDARDQLAARIEQEAGDYHPEIHHGPEGNLASVVSTDPDIIVSAAVGVAGLEATFEAVKLGKRVALANKEVLVVAGDLVMAEVARSGAELLPVDSEHNGVHQCLRAGRHDEVAKLILTASGGPFRTTPAAELENVTPAQALKHPTWKMGDRITIDSATLMNKGFEVIEACRLFGFGPRQVDVLVHPQSIVHALVEFKDGSVVAQFAPADMKLPIQYALFYPERRDGPPERRLDWGSMRQLEFEPPDWAKFPMLGLAYRALETGGAAGCVLNAADEVAVAAFLDSRIPFPALARVVEGTLEETGGRGAASIREILEIDCEAREIAARMVDQLSVRVAP